MFFLSFITVFLLALFSPTHAACRKPTKSTHHPHHQTRTPAAPAATTSAACQPKLFNNPWLLSDITIFTPANQSDPQTRHGSVSFHFSNNNAGLQVETDCSGTVINGSCDGGDGGYVLCENSNVAFKLAPEMLMLEQAYIDDCLGSFPYNSGVAFGQNNTAMSVTENAAGTMATQEWMVVEITAMA